MRLSTLIQRLTEIHKESGDAFEVKIPSSTALQFETIDSVTISNCFSETYWPSDGITSAEGTFEQQTNHEILLR